MRRKQTRYALGRRGVTYIEVLCSVLILGVCLAGLVSMWYFSLGVTVSTDEKGLAYQAGRYAMEQVKEQGFANWDGPTAATQQQHIVSLYFDGRANSTANHTFATGACYRADVATTTDLIDSNLVGGVTTYLVDPNATRTVTINVYGLRLNSGTPLFTAGTLLVKGGP